jgi:hypothetical protein
MKYEPIVMKISDLLILKKNEMLKINSEYQRGNVWTKTQQKKLIDSVLRGYPLPMIYLHYKEHEVAGIKSQGYEIIDGQQRITALFDFSQGAFKLFHPVKDDEIAHFPLFIKDLPCPWASCDYYGLESNLKNKLDETKLFCVKITTESEDEARDLFIRLQAGLPLTVQEKRDAWPGGYTEFVLHFAGKSEIKRYPGHDFFNKWVKKSNFRGNTRQLCAYIGMLFLKDAVKGNWIDLKIKNTDEFYYQNLGLDMKDARVLRFDKILNLALECFNGYSGKKLSDHEAIHIILLLDSLYDDYTKSWQINFIKAFDEFRKNNSSDKKNRSGEYWSNYGMLTQASANNANTIQLRHKFFSEKMFEILKPVLKDETRLFGQLEREIIYYRDDRKCQVCGADISWNDLEIHHVDEHQHGGETQIDNGVSVHKKCHPRGQAAIDFCIKWENIKKDKKYGEI